MFNIVSMEGDDRHIRKVVVDDVRLARNREPDTCPVCNRPSPVEEQMSTFVNTKRAALEAVYLCPLGDCGRRFIAVYEPRFWEEPVKGMVEIGASRTVREGELVLARLEPAYPPPTAFPTIVKEVSPRFASIYDQAAAAEAHGLVDVAGCGYRKAVEFLIKDYAVHLEPESRAEVLQLPLAKVIADHVADPNVKMCASRAVWLGNDEAHYLRTWEDKDVRHLRDLIRLTVVWIESVALTKQYEKEMPRRAGTSSQ